jgi:hypothetical protein
VDALKNRDKPKITLMLEVNNEWVIVSVKDNGKGIPDKVIEKIENNIAVTHGKENGHGIGLTQVRDTLEKNLGKMNIYSRQGHGTTIKLFFPKITNPGWIASEIKIIKDDTVVILDDDNSIHGAWDTRLAPIIEKLPNINIKHFSDGKEVVNFISSLSIKEKRKICLLSDYELLNQGLDGLQVIKDSGIKRSVLVTSHYDNLDLRKGATSIGVKILPKPLVPNVLIKVDKKIKPGSKTVDMVWVDDNVVFISHLVDKYYKHLNVDIYDNPHTFLEDIVQYPLDTKFILDNYYTEIGIYDIDGAVVAKELHEKGYNRLFLLSGEGLHRTPDYLTVILKSDTEALEHLDKL